MLPASAVPVKVGVVTLVMLSVLDKPLSDAVSRSGADGAAGAVVSMVTAKASRYSAEVARHIRCLGGDAVGSCRQGRGGDGPRSRSVATPVPTTVAPSNKVTVLPASAVPVKVGLVTLVRLSVLDKPLSEAATRSGTVGTAGAA